MQDKKLPGANETFEAELYGGQDIYLKRIKGRISWLKNDAKDINQRLEMLCQLRDALEAAVSRGTSASGPASNTVDISLHGKGSGS